MMAQNRDYCVAALLNRCHIGVHMGLISTVQDSNIRLFFRE